jgi:hypothetical protein
LHRVKFKTMKYRPDLAQPIGASNGTIAGPLDHPMKGAE